MSDKEWTHTIKKYKTEDGCQIQISLDEHGKTERWYWYARGTRGDVGVSGWAENEHKAEQHAECALPFIRGLEELHVLHLEAKVPREGEVDMHHSNSGTCLVCCSYSNPCYHPADQVRDMFAMAQRIRR